LANGEEERIALFLDYENLAIGAREHLAGMRFEFKPLGEALAERGRVVVRRAYADWSYFDDDRRMLTRNHVELIEIPQRMGDVRKNAADIKMAVDAIELCLERDYITTFVICTGDSDFTPLVHKLRELNKRVIGVGVRASTSALLPPACDEFIFYEALDGVEIPRRAAGAAPARRRDGRSRGRAESTRAAPAAPERQEAPEPEAVGRSGDVGELTTLVTQTLAGLQRSTSGPVLSSSLKRALLRKDPTFNEGDYGFRAWGELLRFLSDRKAVQLVDSGGRGDPEVDFPAQGSKEQESFDLLRAVVAGLEAKGTTPLMSGLKDQMRKRQADFSERALGYSGFLQFCKAARTRGFVDLEWNEEAEDYVLRANGASR
jgi:uncharacterized protein (TIGR00288 family)